MKIPLIYVPRTKYKYFLEIKKRYKSEKFIVPIGRDCHAAHSLDILNIRTQSLPYDWIRLKPILGLQIVSDNIKEKFEYFLHNLQKNEEGNTYAEKYPNAEFTHAKAVLTDANLRKTFEKRSKRLLNIIKETPVAYLYILEIDKFKDSNDVDFFHQTVLNFKEILKPEDSLHIYIRFDETIDENPIICKELIDKIKPINQVFITSYIREKQKYGIWGNEKAYPKLYKDLGIKIKQIFPKISFK
ncbi:papain-like cysteine peptidase [Chryseobacterium oryctis]|uniref:Papain-like cysteine peptidase n=1 Tax=Chryseobacterium oryctis TaxID=2952618 RepID=A0ABT3HKW0_9FLAO|nr:papain-like cysteine peptidase [Chryseobacterium oryctis]MCW3160401.1 papain-like cysteine peptidase [Chryseobacterium oryctis]